MLALLHLRRTVATYSCIGKNTAFMRDVIEQSFWTFLILSFVRKTTPASDQPKNIQLDADEAGRLCQLPYNTEIPVHGNGR